MSIPVVLIGSLTLTPGSIIIADQQDLISILSIRPVPRRWHGLDPILTNAVFEDISNNITSPASVKDPTVYYRRCRNLCYTTFQGRLCTACVSDFWIWKTHFFFFFEAGNLLPLKKNLRCYSVVRAVIVIFQLVAARWNLCLIFHLSNGFSGCLLIYLECLSSLQVLE